MFLSKVQIPSAAAVLSAAATVSAAAVVVQSAVPHELQNYIRSQLGRLMGAFSNEFTLVIEEFDGLNPNDLYLAAEVYLGSGTAVSTSARDTRRFRATKRQAEHHITLSMERNEKITDTFHGILLTWRMLCSQIPSKYVSDPDNPRGSTPKSEVRYLELSFNKKHKDKIINEYLPYVLEKSKLIKEEKKTLKIFTTKDGRVYGMNGWNPWQSVNLDHPATFDTLAMESRLKTEVLEDLERFVKRKEYYRKVGKAWKRGYLLYGPPGTGKSSLIAAMANYLKFNIYDLELTDIRSNSQLRNLLVSTANQSILVVEDIDCSIELQDRLAKENSMAIKHFRQNMGSTVTLSGLLNFIDGLWSSCGDERIIVFTTNHKDRLDPALLRPGRMDMHIHMSYCTPCGFKMLASNYLGIGDHQLFAEIEKLIEAKMVTPAEVAEQLMKKEGADFALQGLIEFLEAKKETEGNEISEIESKSCGSEDKQEILQDEVEVITEN